MNPQNVCTGTGDAREHPRFGNLLKVRPVLRSCCITDSRGAGGHGHGLLSPDSATGDRAALERIPPGAATKGHDQKSLPCIGGAHLSKLLGPVADGRSTAVRGTTATRFRNGPELERRGGDHERGSVGRPAQSVRAAECEYGRSARRVCRRSRRRARRPGTADRCGNGLAGEQQRAVSVVPFQRDGVLLDGLCLEPVQRRNSGRSMVAP